jgi:hypothetical protein
LGVPSLIASVLQFSLVVSLFLLVVLDAAIMIVALVESPEGLFS